MKITFFVYGILAIAAIALLLSASPNAGSNSSEYFDLAVFIVVVFFIYMFAKLAK